MSPLKGHAKRRAYGQHFLVSELVIAAITDQVMEHLYTFKPSAVLEIGPGAGALTFPIRERLSQLPLNTHPTLQLAEMDRDFASEWQARGLNVYIGDFLEQPESHWLAQTPLLVYSNLPYSSGTAILTRLAEHGSNIPAMVLMFQKEVAMRVAASPDGSQSKDWGSLSLWIQNRWDVKTVCDAPPRAFNPPPKVDSRVLSLTARQNNRIPSSQDPRGLALLQTLIQKAFRQRRKMLRGLFTPETLERKALDQTQLDVTRRAESLGWDEWESWLSHYRKLAP